MKKRTVWLVAAIFVLTGILLALPYVLRRRATAEQIRQLLARPFSAEIRTELGGHPFVAEVTHSGESGLLLCLREPESLAGLELRTTGQGFEASYHGMQIWLDADSELAKRVLAPLSQAVSRLRSGEIRVHAKKDVLLVEGELASGPFCAELDAQTGRIRSITFPQSDFSCNFA